MPHINSLSIPEITNNSAQIQRGLVGVYFDWTEICHIDGQNGLLSYRNVPIADIMAASNYLKTTSLLLTGNTNTSEDLINSAFMEGMQIASSPAVNFVGQLSGSYAASLRAGYAFLIASNTFHTQSENSQDSFLNNCHRIGAIAGLLIGISLSRKEGPVRLDQGENFFARAVLQALLNRTLTSLEIKVFDSFLCLLAEHGSCASTFAARVAASTGASIDNALIAGMVAFDGPSHGGAITDVRNLLVRLDNPEKINPEILNLRQAGKAIPGFGHRIYRCADPRSLYLRNLTVQLAEAYNNYSEVKKADALCEAMKPLLRLGIAPNVDLYAAVLLSQLGVPIEASTAVFTLARSAGWLAHITEQQANNIIIRPLLAYKNNKDFYKV